MSELAWIIVSGLAMSAIALVGSVSVLMSWPPKEKLVHDVVAVWGEGDGARSLRPLR